MRDAVALFLLGLAKAVSQRVWLEQMTMVTAPVMMVALDRLGVRHCAVCPQTQGLTNFAELAYCPAHQQGESHG